MIHLNPVDYPILNKRIISVSPTKDKNIFTVNTSNESCRLFYGKRLSIIIDNETFIGRYSYSLISEEFNNLLIFDEKCPNITKNNTELTIYETFVVPDDNQTVTFQDIQEKFRDNKVPAIVESVSSINDIGSNNLVDGFQTLKIDQTSYGFKLPTAITLTEENDSKFILNVEPNKFNKYHIILYAKSENPGTTESFGMINFELGVAGDCSNYYIKNYSHKIQRNSFEFEKLKYNTPYVEIISGGHCDCDIPIILKLEKLTISNNTAINVYLKLELPSDYKGLNWKQDYYGYIYCRHPQDLLVPEEKYNVSTGISLLFNNNDTVDISDESLLYIDRCGEQRTIIPGETLCKEILIDDNQIEINNLPKGYYKIFKENAPYGIPGYDLLDDHNEYYNSLNWETATLIVYDNNKYMIYTDNKHIFLGSLNIEENKIIWNLLSEYGHTHRTDELIISESTQKKIDEWDATSKTLENYSWRNYSEELSNNLKEYLSKKGDAVIQFDTKIDNNPIIYINTGESIIPASIGILKVDGNYIEKPWEKGTLVSNDKLTKIEGLGIGYKLNGKSQYVLINNQESNYKDVIPTNKFFDLVPRTSITNPGNNSLNIGFDNQIAKNNSIYYGVGLINNEDTEKLIFGRWNNPIYKALIEFGIGSSVDDRKTAFWYSENLLTVSGNFYNNDSSKLGYLLVNGSDPIPNNFVSNNDFSELKEKVEKFDSILDISGDSNIITLIPVDSNYEPVNVKILSVDIYNIPFTVLLTLNGENNFGYEETVEEDDEIETYYELKENYKFFLIYEESKEDGVIDITDDIYINDNGELLIYDIEKTDTIRIKDISFNKSIDIIVADYIDENNLSTTITIDVTL